MHIEVEKLDYELQRLLTVYDAIDVAIVNLETVQSAPSFVDTSKELSDLREKRVFLNVRIIETRNSLFKAYRKHHGDK